MEVKSPERLASAVPEPDRAVHLRLAGTGPGTFPELIDRWLPAHQDRVFLPRRSARSRETVTFARLRGDIAELAAGLHALGIARGDRVGLIADNCYEWLLADLATAYIGGVDVPRGSDTTPAEMAFILRHSGCVATFVQDDQTARIVQGGRTQPSPLRTLISLQERTELPGVRTLPEVMQAGREWLGGDRERLAPLAEAVRPDDLLTIVYTSGTTSDPKGVMLSHGNVLSNVRNVCEVFEITAADSFLSVLPAWHMYERIMDYLALTAGGTLVYTDRRHLKEDLQQERPTVFAAVPRIWETIHDGIVGHAHKLPGLKGRLLRAVLELCRRAGGRRAGFVARCVHALCQRTVLRRLQGVTGGRLRLAVSGGGSLPRHVDECLLGLGLPLLNGYGLTETSPVASVRRPERNGPGHIGPPLPETQIQARDADGRPLRTGEVGVLWIRGPQVMRGYYDNPEKTAAVLDADGWFNSGDLGYADADGNFWITGRAKDTIVLSGGENVEPEPLETVVKTSPYIEQAVIVGQDRKCLGAILVPNVDCLEQAVPRPQWGERDGWLNGGPVLKLLRGELDRLLTRESGFRPMERIAWFRVRLEALTPENGMLTPTLKVRRHVVQERFASDIDAMFAGPSCET